MGNLQRKVLGLDCAKSLVFEVFDITRISLQSYKKGLEQGVRLMLP